MQTALLIAQIISAAFITLAILLQAQGTGFGATWSGGGETYHTRRGLEKVLFYATIIMLVVFIAVSIGIFLV